MASLMFEQSESLGKNECPDSIKLMSMLDTFYCFDSIYGISCNIVASILYSTCVRKCNNRGYVLVDVAVKKS